MYEFKQSDSTIKGNEPTENQSKFRSGECYINQLLIYYYFTQIH